MKTEPKVWDLIPDFGLRLQDAMDHADLTAAQLAERLSEIGLHMHPKSIAALTSGTPVVRANGRIQAKPNPTILTVAAIASACDVPLGWFLQTEIDYIGIYLGR
ncbi:helix-turn-helix domain-containing protein [Allobranchiibius sp. GilTou38]|uniref:helix-turn-helix domain-containing protein n=1 Tax=Allobranchiibius sp. GilTou38 TaxID=2815210 RepID=UPI001AA0CDFB|nr:helix-turn-helix domain-containing protein [Allobranchiibius sp. GilTou38]MBO1768265.1 helix-turn-helix transcriptional regulator [Allobranchiibius sp. GilTou38]